MFKKNTSIVFCGITLALLVLAGIFWFVNKPVTIILLEIAAVTAAIALIIFIVVKVKEKLNKNADAPKEEAPKEEVKDAEK